MNGTRILEVSAAIIGTGALLYFARQLNIPVLSNIAEVVTKGYGE